MKKLKRGKKTGLYYFGVEDIRSWGPCYDPSKYLRGDWRGTAITLLRDNRIPVADRLWGVLHTDLCSEKLMRLFAVWCARQVQHLMKDPRSINALDVAERFANGQATEQERAAAQDAARAAAWAAARAAAQDAARAAAWDAARAAAQDAAWDAAWAAQVEKLIEMIEAEGKGRIK
jgi:hypothetical protein